MNKVKKIKEHRQSIWLDFLDRKVMDSGELQKYIEQDGISGLTSNPAIFEKAITGSSDYDGDLAQLDKGYDSDQDLFFAIAIKDIRRAADIFLPVYEKTGGGDGFVSLEVSPALARDTTGTIGQAEELWGKVDRKNLMVKIPGTREGLGAIRECIGNGINVNVTLLFGLSRYREVAEAYLDGLESRVLKGGAVDKIASVASFFLSRIDVMVDPLLRERGMEGTVGEVAIASAKGAYGIYNEIFTSERFKKLEEWGARPQRLLWASTGTKDPSFSDVKYMEALIGEDTVNTVTVETLEGFRDHGRVEDVLGTDMEGAKGILESLKAHDIDLDKITQELEREGIEKFTAPFDKLLKGIGDQRGRGKVDRDR